MEIMHPTKLIAFALGVFGAASSSTAQIQPDAGPDQSITLPATATLAGSLANRSPLDYWTADGNHATENRIVMYSDAAGIHASPVLHNAAGTIFGWPSDLLEIGGLVYGIESFHRFLYTVDVSTGLCTPIGPANTWKDVYCLAYDVSTDRIFGVDLKKKQLLKFNRQTGKVTMIGVNSLIGFPLIRALAFRDSDKQLYAVDQQTDKLIRIDPANGKWTVVAQLPSSAFSRIEELSFWGDDLYGTLGYQDSTQALIGCQLQRIDLATGAVEDVGPIIDDVSPHSLVIHSIPERFLWSKTSGPGNAIFSDPKSLTPSVSFDQPGTYVLSLTAYPPTGPVSDSVTIDVQPAAP
jgi:hypothetical protein